MAKKETKAVLEDEFSKEQIVNAKTFENNRDLLNAMLENNKKYTLQEVEKIIKKFKKGKV